ncbi:hypothetical protein AAY473_011464 [Plecturocebus cupreus]
MAQEGAVNHESSTTWWEGRWSILLPNGGHIDTLIRCGLAFEVHPVLVNGSGWGSCHGGPLPAGRKMVDSYEPQMPCRVLESVWPGFHGAPCVGGWLRTGQLPWEAHPLLRKMVDSAISLGPTESLIRHGLACTVHPVLAGGSGRSSFHERSTICWQGRWLILLINGGHVESLIRHSLAS